jgi:glycosyltransferase involved in cell wall biosynthesis
MHSDSTVHILMASYQGERYISPQLDSIAAQSYVNWVLSISDDGSIDGTMTKIRSFATRQVANRITVLKGPGCGSVANFFKLIQHAAESSSAEYYAFCDQDDVWLPEKIERAISMLRVRATAKELPQLYCGRTQLVDSNLNPIGLSQRPNRPLAFRNALLQNIAGGNTMVFNRSLLKILSQVPAANSVQHDWTAYQVAAACGGLLLYDPDPVLLYRQHSANVVGGRRKWLEHLRHLKNILRGRYRQWNDQTELALAGLESHMTLSSRQQLEQFRYIRHAKGRLFRYRAGLSSGLYRQTRRGQVAFLTALFFGLV